MRQTIKIRKHQESNKTKAKQPERHDIYVILKLSLSRNKCQSVNSVMKKMGLHLGTPKDHPKMLTNMRERYLHMLISSQKHNKYLHM